MEGRQQHKWRANVHYDTIKRERGDFFFFVHSAQHEAPIKWKVNGHSVPQRELYRREQRPASAVLTISLSHV